MSLLKGENDFQVGSGAYTTTGMLLFGVDTTYTVILTGDMLANVRGCPWMHTDGHAMSGPFYSNAFTLHVDSACQNHLLQFFTPDVYTHVSFVHASQCDPPPPPPYPLPPSTVHFPSPPPPMPPASPPLDDATPSASGVALSVTLFIAGMVLRSGGGSEKARRSAQGLSPSGHDVFVQLTFPAQPTPSRVAEQR